MGHGLADQHFHSYEEAKKWIDSWIALEDMSIFRYGIIYCQKDGRKWSLLMGNTLIEMFSFLIFLIKFF